MKIGKKGQHYTTIFSVQEKRIDHDDTNRPKRKKKNVSNFIVTALRIPTYEVYWVGM